MYGPFWQGRYRAKPVTEERYFDHLLGYIHLNPVNAGIVDDPARYRWSGHGEILGRVKNSIVDVDKVLRLFGTTRRSARAAYVQRFKGLMEKEQFGLIKPTIRGREDSPTMAEWRDRHLLVVNRLGLWLDWGTCPVVCDF